MTVRKTVTVVVVSGVLLVLGACSSDDGDDGTAGVGGTTLPAPFAGASGLGGGGAGGIGQGGLGGVGGNPSAGFGGASGIGGAAGIGGAGGSAGAGAGGTGGSGPPTSAVAVLKGLDGQAFEGTATFTPSGTDIALAIVLTDCTNGIYPVHIHDAMSCASASALGEHWGGTRGEGIPAIVCDGDAGMQAHTRKGATAEIKWSIGTSAADDLIGHVVVVHGASAPIACGVIEGK